MRILILGLPGSGKTTLAKKLSTRWKIPHIEVDKLFFADGDFLGKVKEEADKEHWIMEGHFSKIREIVLPLADEIIWLDPPRILSHLRVVRRCLFKKDALSKIWFGIKDGTTRRNQFKMAFESKRVLSE